MYPNLPHPPQLSECGDIRNQRGTQESDSEGRCSKINRRYYRNIRPVTQSPEASSTGSYTFTAEAPILQTENPPSNTTSDIEYTQEKATPTEHKSLSDSSTTPNDPNTLLTEPAPPKTEPLEIKPILMFSLSPEQIRHENARERLITLLDARQVERLQVCDNLIALVAAEERKSRESVQGARILEAGFGEIGCGFEVEGRYRDCDKGCRGLPVIPDSLSVPAERLVDELMTEGSLVEGGEE